MIRKALPHAQVPVKPSIPWAWHSLDSSLVPCCGPPGDIPQATGPSWPQPLEGYHLGSFSNPLPCGRSLQLFNLHSHTGTPPWGGAPEPLVHLANDAGGLPPTCRASFSARPVLHGRQKQGSAVGLEQGARSKEPAGTTGCGAGVGPTRASGHHFSVAMIQHLE